MLLTPYWCFLLQMIAVGHYHLGMHTARTTELVMQWYIDNIMSLHWHEPDRKQLVLFFLQLEACQLALYCEMTEGTSVMSCKTRSNVYRLLHQHFDDETHDERDVRMQTERGIAHEMLTGGDPSLSDLVHKRNLRWLHKTLQTGARWLCLDRLFATHKDWWALTHHHAEREVLAHVVENFCTQTLCYYCLCAQFWCLYAWLLLSRAISMAHHILTESLSGRFCALHGRR